MKTKIIAVANQKGGVGKTTSTLNIGSVLQEKGNKVLLIDLDPQANLSTYIKNQKWENSISTMLEKESDGAITDGDIVIQTNIDENLDFIHSNIGLSKTEMRLSSATCRELVLKSILTNKIFNKYDYILIDCPPTLGLLLLNALSAADYVIIPVQMQKFALDGLRDLFGIYETIKKKTNPDIEVLGIAQTMMDNTIMAKEMNEVLKSTYGDMVLNQPISKLVEATNSTAEQKSLVKTKNSRLGEEYRKITKEILQKI